MENPFSHDPAEVNAMKTLFARYKTIASDNMVSLDALSPRCQSGNLIALCDEAMSNVYKYPMDKLNRWLGFVQGVLAAVGAIDVDEERDITRPLLHAMHKRNIPSFP